MRSTKYIQHMAQYRFTLSIECHITHFLTCMMWSLLDKSSHLCYSILVRYYCVLFFVHLCVVSYVMSITKGARGSINVNACSFSITGSVPAAGVRFLLYYGKLLE